MRRWSIEPNEQIPFDIRHHDDDLLVVDKPAGVVSEPGKGHPRDSLLNGLFAHFGAALQNLGEERDWGLLHRLDRDTSGLLLVALRNRAYDRLREQFEERRVKKRYLALVAGVPAPRQGVIQKPVAEVLGLRKRAVIRRDAAPAITAYKVLDATPAVSLIEARPATGRLHQIRVHMASIDCPVLGDDTYGRAARALRVPRLCLHAAGLSFVHPTANTRLTVDSPWPADLAGTLKRLGLHLP
ncbi:MAG: RluA family pseudouridine synthase [Phycisphaerae bacterium]